MNNDQKKKERYAAPAVSKMLDIIELLAERNDEMSLNEISRSIAAPINSTYRICMTLEKRGYLNKNFNTGLYQLGMSFSLIGRAALNKIDIRDMALPIMKRINNEFNETVHLCIINDKKLILLDQIETFQPIRIHVDTGTTLVPHASAFGKAILAHFDSEQLEDYFSDSNLEKLTENTITDPDVLKTQLREIRDTNTAYDLEEYIEGVVCAGSAIFGNNIIASIGLVCPRYRIKDKELKIIAKYIKNQAEIFYHRNQEKHKFYDPVKNGGIELSTTLN